MSEILPLIQTHITQMQDWMERHGKGEILTTFPVINIATASQQCCWNDNKQLNNTQNSFPALCILVICKKHATINRYSFENGGLLVLTVSNKPKALWWSLNIFGLYKLSLLWQHFSKLELENQRHLHARVQRVTKV